MHWVVVVIDLRQAFSAPEEFDELVMGIFNGKVAESPKLASGFQ